MKSAELGWLEYIRKGTGRRLSVLGERLGWNWLTYNPLHFQHFHEFGLRNSEPVARAFTVTFPEAKSAVDVGAGSGIYAAALMKHGLRVCACEHSAKGRKMAAKQGVRSVPFDLAVEPPATFGGDGFDLAYCFEVAEHLPPELGDRLVSFLAKLSPVIIFSAAHPGQGGTGHINEQPKAYWIERFERSGAHLQEQLTSRLLREFQAHQVEAYWFHHNCMVFAPGQ